jgi:hypothetical protein
VESLVVLVAVGVVIWFVVRQVWRNSWGFVKGKTLSLSEYVRQYPQCSTGGGMRCASCGASSIKNWGFCRATDYRRLFICNHCNTRLYWSEGASL